MGINLTSPTLNESLLVIDWDCGGDDGLAYVLYGVARVLRGQQARLQAVRDRKEHVLPPPLSLAPLCPKIGLRIFE